MPDPKRTDQVSTQIPAKGDLPFTVYLSGSGEETKKPITTAEELAKAAELMGKRAEQQAEDRK